MATKKKITDDWQQLFPELKKTKLLEMDNRLGPLITGIYLKVVRNTYYTPVAYVHNLCREYSSITTSLECTSETIALRVTLHDDTEFVEEDGMERLNLVGDSIIVCTDMEADELENIVDCDWLCSDGVTESEPTLYYSCIPEIPENYQCLEIVWD